MIRRLILAAGFAAAGTATAEAQITLTPEALRETALAALDAGTVRDARLYAEALVARDPADAVGRFILAQTALAADDPAAARAEAAALWRASADPRRRYEAARLAAFAAAREGRLALARLWLRRALTVAPSPEEEARTVQDFRRLRALDPWSFDIGLSVAPSDNVNGGAASPFNIVEGFPFVGRLSPDAQALSGVAGTLDLSAGYRIAAGGTWRLTLGARAWGRAVRLSQEARVFIEEEQEPGDPPIRDSDFSSALVEVTLAFDSALPGGAFGLDLALGRSFAGGEEEFRHARLGADRTLRLGEAELRLSGFAEQRLTPGGEATDRRLGLQADWRRSLALGATVSAGLSYGRTLSDNVNRANETWTFSAGYSPGRPLGPVTWRLTGGFQHSDFPEYRVILPVPGGRQDDRLFADLEVRLPDVSYAGFTPVVTLGWDRTDSNVSRFSREGLSLDIAIRSAF